jgi:nitrate/TMAO reductase-like tetraheme cytochrome c subunit
MRWDVIKPYLQWRFVLPLLAAAVIGAGAMLVSVEFNHFTSTEKFCSTSCHSMTPHVTDPYYQQSAHISNSAGVRPSCGNCHIPTTNWFLETWVHVSSGMWDAYKEVTTNFDDRRAWEERRRYLANGVRAHMLSWDNAPCKSCHTPASIKPASQTGQVIHATLPGDMACVSCHRNLVHSRPGPMSATDEKALIKRVMDGFVHSRNLSNTHAQKGLTCSSCHGNDLIPDANATGPNAQCGTCHGGIEQVAQSFKGPSHLNPHKPELGNVACTSCHKMHEESKAASR